VPNNQKTNIEAVNNQFNGETKIKAEAIFLVAKEDVPNLFTKQKPSQGRTPVIEVAEAPKESQSEARVAELE
jgi:hypothetical protein